MSKIVCDEKPLGIASIERVLKEGLEGGLSGRIVGRDSLGKGVWEKR
ncbi:MAG: hypothetical protein ACI8Z1_001313 [Candidatus Azotimanducaceae bacterium]